MAFVIFAQSNNITAGILAYIMASYPEAPSTMVSAILSFPPIVGTFSAFAAGPLINRIGVRKLAMIVQVLQFISGMIFLLLGNKSSIYILWFAAACYGFVLGSCSVICTWLLKDIAPDISVRGKLMGYSNAVMSLGGVFFSYMGGIIAARNGGAHWERAYMLCFLILISIAVEFFCIPSRPVPMSESADPEEIRRPMSESADPEEIRRPMSEGTDVEETRGRSRSTHLPPVIWIISVHYAVFFLSLYAFGLNISEYVITVHHLGSSVEAGFAMSLFTMGGIISGLTYSLYSRVLGKYTVPFIMFLSSLGLGLCVFFSHLPVLYIAALLMGFAMLGGGPYIMLEMNRYTEGEQYARATSVFAGLMNVGMMICVYVLAGSAKLVFHDSSYVDGKLFIAFILSVVVCITSIFLYSLRDTGASVPADRD